MRDSEIYRKLNSEAQLLRMAIRQMGFIDMRLQAFEKILKNRKNLFLAFLNPAKLIAKVNKEHLKLLMQRDEEIMVAREEAKKEAIKPKIIMPVGTVLSGNNHG